MAPFAKELPQLQGIAQVFPASIPTAFMSFNFHEPWRTRQLLCDVEKHSHLHSGRAQEHILHWLEVPSADGFQRVQRIGKYDMWRRGKCADHCQGNQLTPHRADGLRDVL